MTQQPSFHTYIYRGLTMSNYKSLIDEAMRTAKYRLNAGVDKTASAPNDSSLIKEASELANALEYMSMASTGADNNNLVGQARAEIVRDFYKSATAQRLGVKLAGDIGESSSEVEGMQEIAPQHGKTKLAPLKVSGGNPLVSAAPDSEGKTMLESYKQAGSSLYDILMHQKEAGDVGEMDASMPAPNIPSSNENSNRSILQDGYVLQGVSKQEAKAPVRARLAEAFAGTSDALGDKTVKAMFPAAYQKGGLKKTAMSRNEQIDAAKNRANMGTAGRTLAGQISPIANLVPAATLAAGHGVEDEDLRARIRGRTFAGGTAGALLGALPGAIMAAPHIVSGNLKRARAGMALGTLGSVGGEMAGQRIALNQLKEASATDVRSRLLSMVND